MNRLDQLERRIAALEARAPVSRERRAEFQQAVVTLRQWGEDARGTTVTDANAKVVVQVVVNRLGTFFDRFADLLEHELSRR